MIHFVKEKKMTDTDWSNPQSSIEGLKKLIKAVPDFPKQGILFRYFCLINIFLFF